ncbi:UDP-glucose 4-epimerase GalE [Malaciobacter marinus]|uniref:UDP-glucose 4-epimerase GalE n=1 Tax=Malaciobacter marinus TaxID=505249 RepID=UPI003AFF7A5C
MFFTLITGGAGYIGTHTLIELSNAGFNFIVYDNLSNSSEKSLEKVKKIIKKDIFFINGDVRNKKKLREVFTNYNIDSVIHFAGLKSVAESVQNPLKYYDNNVVGTLKLLEVMQEFNCKKFVFSSSATVYSKVDIEKATPLNELSPTGKTTNPYGSSKYMIENILKDLYISDNSFKIAILRYFNPIGAHKSGIIGENPNGIPNNLMPLITQVAIGKRKTLKIYGSDYDTHDGTCIRDYIHVVDLANAHVKAIKYLNSKNDKFHPLCINLGTGKGYSVLDVIKVFENISGQKIPFDFADRRDGDIPECYADPSFAKEIIGWEAKKTLEQMCEDSWRWQSKNIDGY